MSDLSGEYPDNAQRYAICISSWEDKFSVAKQVHDIKKQEHFKSLDNVVKSKFAGEKVSIDYDDTLSTDRGKAIAKNLLNKGVDLHIVTRRQETAGEAVYKTAEELSIPRSNVHFTNGKLKWETIKRLGITKHYDNNARELEAIKENVPDVKTVQFAEEEFASYNDYPESASNNACKVLQWREEHGDEVQGMLQVGWTRANQLCNKENISEETIARMASFARHRQNAEVSPEFKDTPWKDKGYVAWLGWGGTTGIEWAQNKLKSIRK